MGIAANKTSRTLVLILVSVVITSFLVAKSYYDNVNNSIDPRIIKARELYSGYNELAREGDYYKLFALLDSIENIYRKVDHYSSSFEMGVMHNNRAAILLTVSMHTADIPVDHNPWSGMASDSLLSMAEENILTAIPIYKNWMKSYRGKTTDQLIEILRPWFGSGLENTDPKLKQKYIERRAKEIENAILENDRRLSVCYSNLGLVHRHRGEYKQAAKLYARALELWDRNLDAENNLNALMGRPVKKRNIIQRMFPPDKDKS